MSKFWNSIYNQTNYNDIAVRLDGQHYIIEESGASDIGLKGYGGKVWLLVRNKQLLVTDNLMHQGKYPSYLGYDNTVIAYPGIEIELYSQSVVIDYIESKRIYLKESIVVPDSRYAVNVFTFEELLNITNTVIGVGNEKLCS